MHTARNTLVVLDPHQSNDLVLAKARQMAELTGTHLHLLVCAKPNGHAPYLNEIQEQLTREGYDVSAEQAWHNSPCNTVLAVQQTEGCDLLIKQHRTEHSLRNTLFTPDDWQLLRHCPSPVLMARHAEPWAERIILSAIDAGSEDTEHRVLQVGILSHAHELARLSQANLHVISAHPYPMLSSSDPIFQLKESIQTYYHEQCKTYQQEFEIDDDHLHIEEGPAEQLIPHLAHKLDAALTIIGSVGRSGITGALIGNTAENVLDALDSDVLVLKPRDVIFELEELAAHH